MLEFNHIMTLPWPNDNEIKLRINIIIANIKFNNKHFAPTLAPKFLVILHIGMSSNSRKIVRAELSCRANMASFWPVFPFTAADNSMAV